MNAYTNTFELLKYAIWDDNWQANMYATSSSGEILLDDVGVAGHMVIVMWRYRRREELNVFNGLFMLYTGYMCWTKHLLEVFCTELVMIGMYHRNQRFRRRDD
jgi:hypothetical protein